MTSVLTGDRDTQRDTGWGGRPRRTEAPSHGAGHGSHEQTQRARPRAGGGSLPSQAPRRKLPAGPVCPRLPTAPRSRPAAHALRRGRRCCVEGRGAGEPLLGVRPERQPLRARDPACPASQAPAARRPLPSSAYARSRPPPRDQRGRRPASGGPPARLWPSPAAGPGCRGCWPRPRHGAPTARARPHHSPGVPPSDRADRAVGAPTGSPDHLAPTKAGALF